MLYFIISSHSLKLPGFINLYFSFLHHTLNLKFSLRIEMQRLRWMLQFYVGGDLPKLGNGPPFHLKRVSINLIFVRKASMLST